MKVVKKISVSFLFLVALIGLSSGLVACGGGGSSNSSSSAETGVRLINAALDYAPLQILSADGKTISSAAFAEKALHGAVSSGPNNLIVTTKANPLAALWSGTVEVAKGSHKSILAFAGYSNQDIQFTVLDESIEFEDESKAAVRIVNAVVDSFPCFLTLTQIARSTSLASLGKASPYIFVSPGSYDLVISSDESVVARSSAELQAGRAYSVVPKGAQGFFVSTSLLED